MADEKALEYLKRLTIDLRETQTELRKLREQAREPIAIVGMGCRFPGGVSSPEEFWELVASGTDAIAPFPSDRGWDVERLYDPDPAHAGTSYTRHGGFVRDVAEFDADFFGIGPREATAMDPQQRLLLEVAWEALEDAGVDPLSLRGTDTGVFTGVMYDDYGSGVKAPSAEIEGYLATGATGSVVSGRLAYVLGLEGPAVSIDTACSSSLVALHLACKALREGECSTALAGGVTVLSHPTGFVAMSRARGLSADGRCKSYSEAADGTGWSEGVGLMVLERLSDAVELGHTVLGVIRGSAVNQDGASNGLTAPNGPSQERVIRQALAAAELEPGDVDAVEGHGTGTTLGDPIEAQALLATYGRERADGPLWLGSLKSNIGHSQAAAGVAGVMKMVLALRHGELPKTLHVGEPSSHVDWSAGGVELLVESRPWEQGERPRRAGVSSFGMSGTNAHVIVEEAPAAPSRLSAVGCRQEGLVPWILSARSEAALAAQAERLGGFVAQADASPVDVGFELAGRARLPVRGVVFGADREQLLERLGTLATGSDGAGVVIGKRAKPRKVAFVFSGWGSVWPGMGLELMESSAVFAESMRECQEALSPHADWSLEDALRAGHKAPLSQQPSALLALGVSLAALWRESGVTPDVVIGHSQGEIAAACVAGGLTLDEATRLMLVRTRVGQTLTGKGALVAVGLPAPEAQALVERFGGHAELAVVNGPVGAVLACDPESADALVELCTAEDIPVRKLKHSVPSHSSFIELVRDDLYEAIGTLHPQQSDIAFFSTALGRELDTNELGPDYWYTNARNTVRFDEGIRSLAGQGFDAFVEISPHPVLTTSIEATLEELDATDGAIVGSLRRDDGGLDRFTSSLAEAFVAGVDVDWRKLLDGGRRTPLPTYAFQRRRYWLDQGDGPGDLSGAGLEAAEHPLLGAAVALAGSDAHVFTGRVSLATHPWLRDHGANGIALMPGAAFVEAALAAGAQVDCELLEELTIEAPLVLPEEGSARLQLTLSAPDEGGRREIEVYSRTAEDEDWRRHATGTLADAGEPEGAPRELAQWPPAGAEQLDAEELYDELAGAGYGYGPLFQGVRGLWRSDEAVFSEVALDAGLADAAGGFFVHPALLDAALHGAWVGYRDGVRLPFSWRGVRCLRRGASALRVRLVIGEGDLGLVAVDERGEPVVSVESLVTRPVDAAQLGAAAGSDMLFGLEWEKLEPAAGTGLGRVAVLGEGLDVEAERFESLDELVAATPEDGEAPDLVFARVPAQVADTLELVRDFVGDERLAGARLVLVSEGGMAVADDEAPAVEVAAAWGLVRAAQAEHPGRLVLIDVDRAEGADWDGLLAVSEPQLAVREGNAFGLRLARLSGADGGGERPRLDDGWVLISGGTGSLGSLFARHLVAGYGVRRLALLSRRGMAADGALELAGELEEQGCEVRVEAVDVADRDALEALVASLDADVVGVVHSAMVLDDGLIASLDRDRLERVMRAKLDGALNFQAVCDEARLFAMFSSATGVWGSPGQGNYAAANSALDALAERRHGEGRPAVSLAWGLWEQAAAAGDDADLARMRRLGVQPLTDEQGLALFDAAVAGDRPVVVPVRLDAGGLRAQARAGLLPPLLSRLVHVRAQRAGDQGGTLTARLAEVPENEREALVLDLVRAEVATVLGHDSPRQVDPERNFKELGFDSLTAVELRNRVAAATGIRLPSTLVFDRPTPVALAQYLLSQTQPAQDAAPDRPARARSDDPIAIVGMGCRFPGGVSSPEELWELVASGTDAVSAFPSDRGWDLERLYDPDPASAGTTYTRHGGFVRDVAEFDADFFGIGPREATAMDPQQRLLLEVAWEALEDAGVDPLSLRGTETGVFTGIMYSDYAEGIEAPGETGGYLTTGIATSVVSGRIAYVLGLEGPAVSIDTACSSSLVAMHLACRALRDGECSMALAGGVTVMSTPQLYIGFAQQRALSSDGRCKAFSDAADGAGVAEGVGLVVLERLSDAVRLGHEVLGVVRGSAVNQDGASNGLTAPNGPSQERVIRAALGSAGLGPADVDAVEAHGTGTTLGDPIEAQALIETYGRERAAGPLWLGSVKSNIGHSQAAAGVAGVMKMVLAMRHGQLPRTLHVDEPSRHIDWDAGGVELLAEPQAWERGERPRRAGVSSFGISGTNAHVIVEEAPTVDRRPSTVDRVGPVPWVLSARSEAALEAQAARLRAVASDRQPVDVGFELAGRARLPVRAVVLGRGHDELVERLAAFSGSGVVRGRAGDRRVGFLFSGQGAQRAGMGAGLYEAFPVFASAFDEVCAQLDGHVGRSMRELAFEDPDGVLDRTEFAQPALFCLEVALFRLVESFGLVPEVLVGHSIGELAAAHVAGVLSLAGACKLVAARGRLMGALPDGGAMVAVRAAEDELDGTLTDGLSVAAVNAPGSLVVAGRQEAVDRFEAEWRERGRKTARLRVSHAFHSELVEPMLDEFREVAAGLSFQKPRIPIVSNVTATTDAAFDTPDYWVTHAREAVRFADAVKASGVTRFVELGPDGTLTALARETLDESVCAPVLRADHDEPETLTEALAGVFVAGVDVDWRKLLDGGRRTPLPTYAFQRRRYWLDQAGTRTDLSGAGLDSAGHPLLGAQVTLPDGAAVFTGRLSLTTQPWLADHLVLGSHLLPGAALVEIALAAGHELGCPEIDELTHHAPLTIPPDGSIRIQVTATPAEPDGRRELNIHTQNADDDWQHHATATLEAATGAPAPAQHEWQPTAGGAEQLYAELAAAGFDHGPAFQLVRGVQRANGTVFADVALDDEPEGYRAHPALLDAALQPLLTGDDPVQPSRWKGVRLLADTLPRALRVRLAPAEDGFGITAVDMHGREVLSVDSVELAAVDSARLARPSLYELDWVEVDGDELETGGDAPEVVLVRAEDVARLDEIVERRADTRLVVTIRMANAVTEDDLPDLDAAAAWSVVREAQDRHPGRITLLDVHGDGASAEEVQQVLRAGDEDQLALRDGRLLAPRLARAKAGGGAVADGTVLITDDAGGLGTAAARELIAAVPARRVVVARDGALDLDCEVEQCDLTDPDALASLVESIPDLRAVVHAADGAETAGRLDRLTERLDLEAFVLLSPAPPADGDPVLRALAHRRRARGLAATHVACDRVDAVPAVLAIDRPFVAATEIDRAALLAGDVPPLWRGLGRQRRQGAPATDGLASLPREEWAAAALELVRREAAIVLGHASGEDVDPQRAFIELGFDSIGALTLRDRLNEATGLALAATLALDHPTPAAVASRILEALEHGDAGAVRAGTLGLLLKQAHERGAVGDGLALLTQASKLSPRFESVDQLGELRAPLTIASGDRDPILVCLPSFLLGAGPQQFARLARRLHGTRTVLACGLPGFGPGEPVPASRHAAFDALAASIGAAVGEERFVLAGYSAGAAVAHAVAEKLEEQGRGPSGVVLIDPYLVESDRLGEVVRDVVGRVLDREHELISLGDDDLLAMGAYMGLSTGWEPGPLDAPRLLIRARETPSGHPPGMDVVEVEGDHFAVIEANAAQTADAIEAWLDAARGATGRPLAGAH